MKKLTVIVKAININNEIWDRIYDIYKKIEIKEEEKKEKEIRKELLDILIDLTEYGKILTKELEKIKI